MQELVQLQTGDGRWGQHAQRIAGGEMWDPPGNGGHDDKAHPPIHPTKYSPGTFPLSSVTSSSHAVYHPGQTNWVCCADLHLGTV